MSFGVIFATVIALSGTIFGAVVLFKLGASLNPRKNNPLINIFCLAVLNIFVCALLPVIAFCFGNSVASVVQIGTLIVPVVLFASLLAWWKRTEPELGLFPAMDKHLYNN